MWKVIGYENKEYGRKEMILERIDEKTDEQKARAKENCRKIAEKFGIKY